MSQQQLLLAIKKDCRLRGRGIYFVLENLPLHLSLLVSIFGVVIRGVGSTAPT